MDPNAEKFDPDIFMRSIQCGDYLPAVDTMEITYGGHNAERLMRKKAYGEMYADKAMRWSLCGPDDAVVIMRWP